METYEITVALPNGDWRYVRRATEDFHEACEYGLEWANRPGMRLVSVMRIEPRIAQDADQEGPQA